MRLVADTYDFHRSQAPKTAATVAFGFGIGGPVKIPLQIKRLTPRERALLAFALAGAEGGRPDGATVH
jgi:hypothetical protein